MFRKLLPICLFAALACGCAARHDIVQSYAAPDSGINGHLVATESADGSVKVLGGTQGRVGVTTADETTQVATIDTDSRGNFEIGLRPGSYFVYTQPMDGMLFGRRVAVAPHQMTQLELQLPEQQPY
jgi:hypothetical protein